MSGAYAGHQPGDSSSLCRIWILTRRDGQSLGFTDHDSDLTFDGRICHAGSGLSASAFVQSGGLSVDNSEALGALSAAAITEEDLAAGRYDGAGIAVWLADWQDLRRASQIFAGSLGEISRRGAAFRCELRGLSEALSQPAGHAYGRSCSAVLGDSRCRFAVASAGYSHETEVTQMREAGRIFALEGAGEFEPGWFAHGILELLSGPAAGLRAMIRSDEAGAEGREISLWQSIRAPVRPGDRMLLVAGCDKRALTCQRKFDNLLNYRGFPYLPGEDWLTTWPRQGGSHEGGSLALLPGLRGRAG